MEKFSKDRILWFDMRNACRRRILELERIKNYIIDNGFTVAKKIEDADVLIVYRCCFNSSEEAVSLNYLNEAAFRFRDIVCLSGLLNIYSVQELKQKIDACRIYHITLQDESAIDNLFSHNIRLADVPLGNYSWAEPDVYSIQVGLGCDSNCSYCGDKKIVGTLRSFSLDSIIYQFENGLNQGYKNFSLVGDDVGAWGRDIGSDIMTLLDKVISYESDYSVTMQEVNIRYLIKNIQQFETILQRNKIKFLVVAFQHINDRILKLMYRDYTRVEVESVIQLLVKYDVKIRFHVILGFPSETREELFENINFICSNGFESGSFFIYQPREYAPSARFSGHLSASELKDAINFTRDYLTTHGYNVIDETRLNNIETGNMDKLLITRQKTMHKFQTVSSNSDISDTSLEREKNDLYTRFKNKYGDKSGINEKPSFPRDIKIEVSSLCNYKCIFCWHSLMKTEGEIKLINDDLCKKILMESYMAGTRTCSFHHRGEPLLNGNLENYVSYAKRLGYEYIYFTTNGFLLEYERGKRLLDAGLDSIKFSINASRRYYKIVHGVDGYDKVLDNIEAFYNYRLQSGKNCKIFISIVVTKQTMSEVDAIKKDVEKYADEIIIVKIKNFGGILKDIYGRIEIGDDEYRPTYPCTEIFNNLIVSCEGYLLTCCFFSPENSKAAIADLNKCSVTDAWNSEKFADFRKRHLTGNLKGTQCYNCLNSADEYVQPLLENVTSFAFDYSKKQEVFERIKQIEDMNSSFSGIDHRDGK